jgi:hypothetical protein
VQDLDSEVFALGPSVRAHLLGHDRPGTVVRVHNLVTDFIQQLSLDLLAGPPDGPKIPA